MPTAVEFDAGALENTFLKIDTDFLQLSTATPETFGKIDESAQIKHDISVIGNFFLKLDDDFLKIGDTAQKVDILALKLAPVSLTGGDGGVPAVQSDFLKLEAFLKTSAGDLGGLGADFLKLDTAPNLGALKQDELSVSNDFLKVSTDATDVGAAFIKLGEDLAGLGNGLDHKLDDTLKIIGGELGNVGLAFDAIALDDHKLGLDFELLGRGGSTDSSALVASFSSDAKHVPTGMLGSDFYKLEQDFLVLNQALSSIDFGKLVGALNEASGKLHDPSIDRVEQLLSGHGGSISDHG